MMVRSRKDSKLLMFGALSGCSGDALTIDLKTSWRIDVSVVKL